MRPSETPVRGGPAAPRSAVARAAQPAGRGRRLVRPGVAIGLMLILASLAPGVASAQAASADPSAAETAASGASELADRFPETIEDKPLEVQSLSGSEWLARYDAGDPAGQRVIEATEALVAAGGGTVDDLTVATALGEPGPGNHAAISAIRVAGAEAPDLVRPAIELLFGDITEPELRLRSISGKAVIRVSDTAMPGAYPRTVYPVDDTVWLIEADQPLLAEILAGLPASGVAARPSKANELAMTFPTELAGVGREELVVSAGWSLSDAPGSMFGLDSEEAAVRLFLESGVTFRDLTEAYGVWADDAGFVALVVAFQVAGADPAVLQGLLEEVLLPRFTADSEQPRRETTRIADRDVLVVSDDALEGVDRQAETYYFFVEGDTIWVVNSASPDEAVLAEAFRSLP